MLVFQLEDGNQVEIAREAIEEKILVAIFARIQEARENSPGMYSAFKGAVNLVLGMGAIDLKVPKGENALEYLIAHYAGLGLDVLEKEPLAVSGKVVTKDGEIR